MQAIDERMETLGGTSKVGEGTSLTITPPLRNAAQNGKEES
jgi:hypothetical protein